MADFDPRAYLAKKRAPQDDDAFDARAYLAKKKPTPAATVQEHPDRPASFAPAPVQLGPDHLDKRPRDAEGNLRDEVAEYDAAHPWYERNIVGPIWSATRAGSRLPGMDRSGAEMLADKLSPGLAEKANDLADTFEVRHDLLSVPVQAYGAAKGAVGSLFGAASKGANAVVQPARPLTRMATETLAGAGAAAGSRVVGNAIAGKEQNWGEPLLDALVGGAASMVGSAGKEAVGLAGHDRYLKDYQAAKAGGHYKRPEVQRHTADLSDESISEASRANRDVAFGAAKSKLDTAKSTYKAAEQALEQSGAELDGAPVWGEFSAMRAKNRIKATGAVRDQHLENAIQEINRLVPANTATGRMTAEDLVAARRTIDENLKSLQGPEKAAWTKVRKAMNSALDNLAQSEPAIKQLREADAVYSSARKMNREVADIMTGSGEDAQVVASKSAKRRQAANTMRYAGEGTRPGLDRREEIERLAALDPKIREAVENQRAIMADAATRFGLPHAGTHTFTKNIYALPLQQGRAVARVGVDMGDTMVGRAAQAAAPYALPSSPAQLNAAVTSGWDALRLMNEVSKRDSERRAKRVKGDK